MLAKPIAEIIVQLLNDDETFPVLRRGVDLRASGEDARFRVTWTSKDGVATFRLSIRRADGTIES